MWIEKVVGDLGDKKKYREYKARVALLPASYRDAAAGLSRYLMYLGPSNDGKALIAMLTDLADLLEQASAAGTPIRDVVGSDPVDFADLFMANYGGGSWIRTEQQRLATAIDRAAAEAGR